MQEVADLGALVATLDPSVLTPARLDAVIPRPHERRVTGQTLMPEERNELERCEALPGIANLAFWMHGRVLATINQAQLYLEDFPTFDEYVNHVWEISPSRAPISPTDRR